MKVRKIGKRWKVFTYTLTFWMREADKEEWGFVEQRISRMDRTRRVPMLPRVAFVSGFRMEEKA